MPIDIQSLFRDVIETPAQAQQRMMTEGILKGRELTGGLTGLARTQAPLVSALSMQMPQRQEAMRRGVGGMLGLDVRTESEKVQDALKDVDPNDPQSLIQAAQAVGNLGLGTQAAQMRAMAADVTRQQREEFLKTQQLSASMARDIEATAASVSEREERQRRAEAIPGTAAAFREAGEELLASAVESGAMTAAEAYSQSKIKKNTSDEQWARLSNSKIFNRTTGEVQDFGEDETIAHTLQVGEGGNARIFAIGQDGSQLWNVSAAELVASQNEGRPVNVDEPTTDRTSGQSQAFTDLLTENLESQGKALTTIGRAKTLVNARAAGMFPRVVEAVAPEEGIVAGVGAALTQANVNLSRTLDQLQADIAFNRLQRMREESKTGGALGNVSNIELQLLSSSIASLSTDLDPEILMQNLEAVEKHYNNVLNIEMGIPVVIDLEDPIYQGRFKETSSGEIAAFIDGQWMIIEDEPTLSFKKF